MLSLALWHTTYTSFLLGISPSQSFLGEWTTPTFSMSSGALREKGWAPSFNVLCDATGVQELVLRPGELEKFVTMLNEPDDEQPRDSQAHGVVAVVVQRPLDYSVASLYKELAARHGFRAEVCWSRKRAYEHLGLDGVAEAIEQELQ